MFEIRSGDGDRAREMKTLYVTLPEHETGSPPSPNQLLANRKPMTRVFLYGVTFCRNQESWFPLPRR
ncbi:MAG: hypothetical protein CMO40_04640 [Verrucomicrobiaceae bacterium]|nr:hypothetical protein [Verrucomicrobiaceae bacterium]